MARDLSEQLAAEFPQLTAEFSEQNGQRWLTLSAVIAQRADFNSFIALRHNFDLVVGQVRFNNETTQLTQSILLGNEHDRARVQKLAGEIVSEADRTREMWSVA